MYSATLTLKIISVVSIVYFSSLLLNYLHAQVALNDIEVSIENIHKLSKELQVSESLLYIQTL